MAARTGRGGGQAGSDTRKWVRDGVPRNGPVMEEPTMYPLNPDLQKAPQLDSAAANTVLTYRLLTNHWRSSECFVGEHPTKVEVGLHSSTGAIDGSDLDIQKEAIVSFCGSDFFPPELLQAKFVRTTRGPGKSGAADSKRQKLKEMEQKESESKGLEDKTAAGDGTGDDDLFGADEQDDFGGDDYARDYYADEDMDDNFEDGDDGGIL